MTPTNANLPAWIADHIRPAAPLPLYDVRSRCYPFRTLARAVTLPIARRTAIDYAEATGLTPIDACHIMPAAPDTSAPVARLA